MSRRENRLVLFWRRLRHSEKDHELCKARAIQLLRTNGYGLPPGEAWADCPFWKWAKGPT